MKHSLKDTGLSLSQAQSISNLCFQKAKEIANKISIINNSEKTLVIGSDKYTETVGNKIPDNIVSLVIEKGLLHATQAFLMENIKAKDTLIKELKTKAFVFDTEEPEIPLYKNYTNKPLVDEKWGWSQLSVSDYNEYLEQESYASHIGQFIHQDSKLDLLRKELPHLKTLEWINVEDGKKTPLKVEVHHTSEQLLSIHNELASKHRKYEQRVNYFKAKVKNLVTEENARIANENAVEQEKVNTENELLRNQYRDKAQVFNGLYLKAFNEFKAKRQEDIKKTSSLRIEVDERFKPVVDSFLKEIGTEE